MTNSNENKKTKINTKVVYSADIIAEYEEKKKDPKYANCLDTLEKDFNFAMLNYKISQIKNDDSCSKQSVLDLKIESGLFSDTEVKKFKKSKKELHKKLQIGRAFVITKIITTTITLIIGGFILYNFYSLAKPLLSTVNTGSSINSAAPSTQNSNKLKFINNLNGNNKFTYAFKNMSEELKLNYAYDKLASDSQFSNLSQDEKDKYIQDYFKNLSSDQKNDFVQYFLKNLN